MESTSEFFQAICVLITVGWMYFVGIGIFTIVLSCLFRSKKAHKVARYLLIGGIAFVVLGPLALLVILCMLILLLFKS